jgi:uroporphyrinogen decarboxylase
MTASFQPDFNNLVQAARNQKPLRYPLYEHIISENIMERVLDKKFADLIHGDLRDKREYMQQYVRFYRAMGYDTVSFECLVTAIMPGSGALYSHAPGCIRDRADFKRYSWSQIPDTFFSIYGTDYKLLVEELPPGMKAVGGPGNGVFECVQDVVGYEQLCYIAVDDPELYADLFTKVGEVLLEIWSRFLSLFGDAYALCRLGDDLGFRSATLISPEHIRMHIISQYRKVVSLVHSWGKPFLLHSCGNIFAVMNDLIDTARIDAKHSNEDAIAPFSEWLDRFGGRIGNFGGFDTDVLCQSNEQDIKQYVDDVVRYAVDHGGVAFGSGNSIPEYVPVSGYLAMVERVRELRGESPTKKIYV